MATCPRTHRHTNKPPTAGVQLVGHTSVSIHGRPAFSSPRQVYQNYVNLKPVAIPGADKTLEGKLRRYFQEQDEWLRTMISKHSGSDPYWRHVAYVMAQFDGLYDGYRSVAEKSWVCFAVKIIICN